MPSSPQTVASVVVFDYVYDTAGKAVSGARVQSTLNFNQSTLSSPAVSIGPIQQSTTTDSNGYWQLNLVPNVSIGPANTTYTIQTPYNAYDISIPSGAGPFQSTAAGVIVNTPVALAPATTNLTGPITVTGNETVTGNLTVNGTTTLGSTTTGALSTGAVSASGDLTILSAFRLLFGAAVSKLVPGATSFSIRNNADSADNLKVTDAGAATVRNGLTVTAGGETITAGGLTVTAGGATVTAGGLIVSAGGTSTTGSPDLTLGTTTSRIVPGATSLSLRNNANNADNILITDAGAVTIRNATTVTAGGFTTSTLGVDVGSATTTCATFTGKVSINGHILSTGPTPTLGSLKSGVSTQSISGSDNFAKVVITTAGSSPPGTAAAIFDLNFSNTWGATPVTTVTQDGTGVVWAATASNSTSTFTVFHGGTSGGVAALAVSTTYNYGCISGGAS